MSASSTQPRPGKEGRSPARSIAAVAGFLGIEAGDLPRVGWLFAHSVCVGIFVSFLFCVGNAIFLGHYGAEMLPWGYVGSGVLGALVVKIFSGLGNRVSFSSLLFGQLGFLVASVVGLYLAGLLLPGSYRGAVAFGLFVFIGPALTVANLEFWSLARKLFDIRQSKRYNPLVDTGETLASIAGFFLVPLLSPDETLHLLVPALAGLAGSFVIVWVLRRRFALESADVETGRSTRRSAAARVPRDRYFGLTAAVMLLVVACHYLIDFAFLSELEKQYTSTTQVAAFFGVFFGAVKALDLLLKGFVSGRLVRQFGLRSALGVLPSALLVSVSLALLFGAKASILFLFVALTKLLWPVLRKSIFDPAFKVLYQPLPEAQSLGLQNSIDGTVRQIGTFLIGLALLVSSSAEVAPRTLLASLLVILVAWIALLGPLYREYRKRLMGTLSQRETPPLVRSTIEELGYRLGEAEESRREIAIRWLNDVDPTLLAAIEGRLDAATMDRLEKRFVRRDDPALRCRILELFAVSGDEQGERLLVQSLGIPDPSVHLAAIRGLVARGYRARGRVAILLRDDLERSAGDMTWNLAALADLRAALRRQPHLEAICRCLQAEIEEQRGRLFLLLALLFDARAVGLAREGLVTATDGGESTANALELLETLISDELRPLVLPLVEDLPAGVASKRMEGAFPIEQLDWRERLGAIVQRAPGSLGSHSRVVALEAIEASCDEGTVAEELLACLFHPDPLLREVAVVAVGRLDLEQCRERLRKMPFEARQQLLPLTRKAAGVGSALPRTILDRLRLIDTLGELPRHVGMAVATHLESRISRPGETPAVNESELSWVVHSQPIEQSGSAPRPFGSAPGSTPLEGGIRELYIDGIRLRKLLRRHTELWSAVLRLRPVANDRSRRDFDAASFRASPATQIELGAEP